MKLNADSYLGIVILTMLLSCTGNSSNEDKDVVVNNMHFSRIRYQIDYSTGDTLYVSGLLRYDAVIDGYPCAATWVDFTPDWKLRKLRLSEDYVFHNSLWPKNTWIWFDEFQGEKHIGCAFPKDVSIQGYLIRGSRNNTSDITSIHCSFYTSGQLMHFYPRNDVKIQEIYCSKTLSYGIQLYRNGALRSCKLTEDQFINEKKYAKGTIVNLDEEGNTKP
ncbi:MAG: hypothetical protein JW830_13465 [Bacteroidales bacterium]|nr:hypothetical protein [Bacteroidales bacterium]